MTNAFYESIIEHIPIGFAYLKLIYDQDGDPIEFDYLRINHEIEHLFNLKREDLIGKAVAFQALIDETQPKDYFDQLIKIATQGGTLEIDLHLPKSDRTFRVDAFSPQRDHIILFMRDVTDRSRLLNDVDVFFKLTPDLLSIQRTDGLYLKVNPAWTKILGYEPEDIEGKFSWQFLHPEDQLNDRTLSKQLETNASVLSFINRYRHHDGTYRILEWDSQREGDTIYSSARDITERIQKEEKIEYLSFHDVLTGLYNRRFLEEEVKRLDVPRNLPLTIVMGDLNRLKLVNDAFGHEKGDELIVKAAQVIKGSCRPEDLIARWGGDEFLIFLPKTKSEDAFKIIDRIHQACINQSVNSIGVSIAFGSATKAFMNETIEETMKLAEDSMYKAKSKESERSRKDIIDVIASTLYNKIPFEEQHAKRVSFLCAQMATVLGFSPEDIQKVTLAGLLHDIGKIAISSEILKKQTALSSAEWDLIKTHTEIGAKVVGSDEHLSDVGQAILYHHERYDGSGYPKGIRWEEIPIASRIIALADSFDTMISQNTYKPNKTRDEAIADIRSHKGSQFDPQLAEIFITQVLGEKLKPS